jgi:hypothetical protein
MKHKRIWISVAILIVLVLVVGLYPRQTGYIKIETPGLMLNLHRSTWGHVMLGPSTEPKAVRTGTYTPSYANYVQEDKGDKWQLHCTWSRSVTGVQVNEGETAVLDFGPPFQWKPELNKMGHIVLMGLALTGRGGERYDVGVQKNGRLVPAPKLTVVDEAGTILGTGQFEYG